MSAWGAGGKTLAQRMRERAERDGATPADTLIPGFEVAPAQPAPPAEVVGRLLRPDGVDEEFHHAWPVEDGAVGAPVVVGAANSVVVVAVAATDAERGGVLLVREDGGWCLPSAALEANETFAAALARVAAGDLGLPEPPVWRGVVGVEHYPTLHRSWMRVTVGATLPRAEEKGEAAGGDGARWHGLDDVVAGRVELAGGNFCRMLERGDEGVPMPSAGARGGFACHLVDAVVVHGGRALLLGGGRLPCTHVDRGENAGFAASRTVRSAFGLVADIDGVLAVEHAGRSDAGLDGVRITVRATVKSLKCDPGYKGTPPPHSWVTADEAGAAAAAPHIAEAVRRALGNGGGPVPLQQIDQTMEEDLKEKIKQKQASALKE